MAKKVIKKSRVPKTRNGETMTESAYWSFIRSGLRQKSRWWKPISDAKLLARRPYQGANKRRKYEYQCNQCKKWFAEKEINVDHIIPAGTLTCSTDLPGFVDRLFVEIEGLQVLCETCHNVKTQLEKPKKKTNGK